MARWTPKHLDALVREGRRRRALGSLPQGIRPADVAVVFDLGGVVVRWRNGPTYRRLATRLNLPFRSVEHAMESTSPALLTGRLSGDQFWDRLGRRLGCRIPAELRNLWAEDFARDARVDPQILRWIGRLRATGVRVACLSNNIVWHARVLRSRGWLREFSPALLPHEIGAAKPSRRAYDRARVRIGLPARSLLLVDDLWANVVGARRAGWGAVRFRGFAEARRRVERWLPEAKARRSARRPPLRRGETRDGRPARGPQVGLGSRRARDTFLTEPAHLRSRRHSSASDESECRRAGTYGDRVISGGSQSGTVRPSHKGYPQL